jgi:nucleotide-binding universal stress UspA family protein
MNKILACIDGSVYTQSVRDHAIWAASRLSAPLEFLHTLDRHPERASMRDLSGNIGLDSQDNLLFELAALDEKRSKLSQQHGREMLEHVTAYARSQGIASVEQRLRHGALVDTLTELESDVRLFVMGKRGEHADFAKMHLGSEVERAVRAVHRPLLIASRQFKPIERFLVAFDGSDTTRKGVEMVAGSPLFKNLQCHVLMVANETADARGQVQWAQEKLSAAGIAVESTVRPGTAESVIAEYVSANAIGMIVMGAYGHSRIRQLIIGSTTSAVIRTCLIPVLLLR